MQIFSQRGKVEVHMMALLRVGKVVRFVTVKLDVSPSPVSPVAMDTNGREVEVVGHKLAIFVRHDGIRNLPFG